MTSPDPDFDSLVDALRADLPSKSDERRVRRRLLAAGVGVATSVVAPGATASVLGAGASVPAALLQKFGALSWTVKLGLAGVAATAALPATAYLTRTKPSSPVVEVAPLAAPAPARLTPPRATALPVSDLSAPAEASAVDSIALREPATVASKPAPESPDSPGTDAPRPTEQASSAAFPLDEDDGARARSALDEETVLMERALYALRRGDRDGARCALAEHARRFPSGLLARERDRAFLRANAADDANVPATPPTTDSVRTP